jgi:hypothetical protein
MSCSAVELCVFAFFFRVVSRLYYYSSLPPVCLTVAWSTRGLAMQELVCSGEAGVRLLFASPGGEEVADAITAAPWSSSASAASTVGRESALGIAPSLPSI